MEMDSKLYALMDWAAIEEITFSESDRPGSILGAKKLEDGFLFQTFLPTAQKIQLCIEGNKNPVDLEMVDEAGFFAGFVGRKKEFRYHLQVTYDNDTTQKVYDPYSFKSIFTQEDMDAFGAGIHYEIYHKLGAKPMTLNGVEGVNFACWAPEAMRVSVVGDFNLWDGRRHQMNRLGDSGIFELFLPGVKPGDLYKFEVKNKRGEPMLKADPYAFASELRPNTASVVADLSGFSWEDGTWMREREKRQAVGKAGLGTALNIYEVHLGSWMRKEMAKDEAGEDVNGSMFYSYREIAPKLAAYVKKMNYTHIELMPIMEHPLDGSWGYQVTGYYSPTSRYGTPQDFMYFMDYMHRKNIGVILDWVPAHFPRDIYGLACFDGSCLYEHADPRRGAHPHWGTLIYNYARPQVSNFLIANALFWADLYHVDGIRMDAVASMLYLDYGKNAGEWLPNIYGGHENLDAIEFLKHLNSIFKKKFPSAVLIAEESTAWPLITGDLDKEGLGFDYKWNMGWMNDFLEFMKLDPYFRSGDYNALTFSMLYQYSENFILVLSHDEVVHGKATLAGKMPGATQEEKFANLRVAYGYMTFHPGKKLLFMGQEFGQMDEWNEDRSLEWELLDFDIHSKMQKYVKALNKFYLENPALWEKDYDPEGFEWVNCTAKEETLVVFIRKGKKKEEDLLVVCNFTPVVYTKSVGVPREGTYVEVFNSDDKKFGGSGVGNKKPKKSVKVKADLREDSIEIKIPPMGVAVFKRMASKKRHSIPAVSAEEKTGPKEEPVLEPLKEVSKSPKEPPEPLKEAPKPQTGLIVKEEQTKVLVSPVKPQPKTEEKK